MTSTEIKALFVILVIVTGVCAWILSVTMQHRARLRMVRFQELQERESEGLPTRENWTWPKPDYHKPRGEWGGPSKVLEKFLERLHRTGIVNVTIKVDTTKVKRQLEQINKALGSLSS